MGRSLSLQSQETEHIWHRCDSPKRETKSSEIETKHTSLETETHTWTEPDSQLSGKHTQWQICLSLSFNQPSKHTHSNRMCVSFINCRPTWGRVSFGFFWYQCWMDPFKSRKIKEVWVLGRSHRAMYQVHGHITNRVVLIPMKPEIPEINYSFPLR